VKQTALSPRDLVYHAVAAIPRGQVRTYGEVAEAVGRPGAARAVGNVLASTRFAAAMTGGCSDERCALKVLQLL
jgi:alkylated DNA nucleotide flippase Atl1